MQRAFDNALCGLLGDWRGPLLLAVSGGVDSMVMLYLAQHSSLECGLAVAHVNFSLRPGDCDRDEELVRTTCAKAGIPFFTKKFDTLEYAATTGVSLEMAARELRYGWFPELMQEHGYGRLLVAHNQNDAAETLMLNMLRGTGLRGLGGIRAVNGAIVRPMLGFSRSQIEAFAREKGIAWREDVTNGDTAIVRNRIRHNVFPEFEKINPSFLNTFSQEMERFAQASEILDEMFESKRAALCSKRYGAVCISIEALAAEPHRDYWMYRLMEPYGFTSSQIADALEAIGAQSGKVFCSAGYKMIRDREFFKIYPLEEAPIPSVDVTVFDRPEGFDPRLHPDNVLYADADTLCLPLRVRPWSRADRFHPLGMRGSRLVSDFFSDMKLDLEQKRRAGIVCFKDSTGEHIVAITGIPSPRIDDRHKITSATRRIAAIRVICNR